MLRIKAFTPRKCRQTAFMTIIQRTPARRKLHSTMKLLSTTLQRLIPSIRTNLNTHADFSSNNSLHKHIREQHLDAAVKHPTMTKVTILKPRDIVVSSANSNDINYFQIDPADPAASLLAESYCYSYFFQDLWLYPRSDFRIFPA
jgi:hypothetical protein